MQRRSAHAIMFAVMLLAAIAAGTVPVSAENGREATIAYTIIVPPDHSEWIDVKMTVATADGALASGMAIELELPEGASLGDLESAPTDAESSVQLTQLSPRLIRVFSDTNTPLTITYRMRLHSGLQNPGARRSAPYASVHLGEFVYVAGRDSLARVTEGLEIFSATIAVDVPSEWRAFAVNIGTLRPGEETFVDNPDQLVLLLGPLSISHYEVPDGGVTFVTAGELPWGVSDAARSVQAMMAPLRARGLTDFPKTTTFVQIRYPGPLRINPLITGHVLPGSTIIHWIGTGGLDWWNKHAARDIVSLLLERTMTVAPDATWFVAGLPEYVGLLLLYEAGYMTVDDLYRALGKLYEIGIHYTGPGWPSLVSAGTAMPRSHAAQRVLEFRAPLVAFLLDAEIRRASAGEASIFTAWAHLAAEQRRSPEVVFDTALLLPPLAAFGDLSTFAEDFLYGSRIPPVHFDAVFQRWLVDLP